MFSCIRLRKRKQSCEPKIGGETLVTSNLSSGSSMDQIHYMAMCERVLRDIAPMDSCHLHWDGHGFVLKHFILMNLRFI